MDNSVQLRIELAMEPETQALISHVISGPGVGGELEAVTLKLFSDYFRYVFLVWGDPGMEATTAFSWRREEWSIPERHVDLASKEVVMLISSALAYVEYDKDTALLEPSMRLVTSLRMYLESVIELSDRFLNLKMPEDMLKEIAKIREQAVLLASDLETYAYNSFEDHLREFTEAS